MPFTLSFKKAVGSVCCGVRSLNPRRNSLLQRKLIELYPALLIYFDSEIQPFSAPSIHKPQQHKQQRPNNETMAENSFFYGNSQHYFNAGHPISTRIQRQQDKSSAMAIGRTHKKYPTLELENENTSCWLGKPDPITDCQGRGNSPT